MRSTTESTVVSIIRHFTMRPTAASSSRSLMHSASVSVRLGTQTYRFAVPSVLARHLPSQASSSWFSNSSDQPPLALALATPHQATEAASPSWSEKAAELGSALWNGILLAAPKSRVSHSRKRMRSANKGLKDRVDFVHCSACGKPKLFHHICPTCYFELTRFQKQTQRLQVTATASSTSSPPAARGHGVQQKSLNPAGRQSS